MSSLLPSVSPITDSNAGPTPSVHSTSLAPIDLQRGQQAKSPSGLSALLGSITGSSGVGLLGGLLSSGLGMIGDAINYKRQNKLYDKQRNDALADYERQRSDYLSDLASERVYNSPEAQAARLKAAGINPNTVFGSGSVANTSSEAQNQAGFRGSAAPSPVNSGLGSAFAQGFTSASSGQIQSGSLDVQAQQMRSNVEMQKAQMLRYLADVKDVSESAKGRAIQNGYLDYLLSSNIAESRQRISESIDRMRTNAIQRFKAVVDANVAQGRLDLESAESKKRISLMEAEINKFYADVQRINQEYEFLESTKDFRYSQEKEKDLQIQYDNAEKKFKSVVFNDWLKGLTYEEFGSWDNLLLKNYLRKMK